MNSVHSLMQSAIDAHVFPGAVLLVSQEGCECFHEAYGVANTFTGRKVERETVFDLASLTKPLATALAMLRLASTGGVGLEDRIASHLPEIDGIPLGEVQVRQLLLHTSGLPAYRAFYRQLQQQAPGLREQKLQLLLKQTPLEAAPGRRQEYSDLGYMVLDWIIHQVTGRRLDRYVGEEVYTEIDLAHISPAGLFFCDLDQPRPRLAFAATEFCPWRNKLMEGEVHDENAYAMGGIQGHAGLFGSAAAVHRLLERLLAAYCGDAAIRALPPKWVTRFMRKDAASGRALGFDAPAAEKPSAGRFFSEQTVGHLGFTGTSFWIDLKRGVVVILLTNRVHPTRANEKIKGFRPRLHDAVMTALNVAG